jgi:hypothetical protein
MINLIILGDYTNDKYMGNSSRTALTPISLKIFFEKVVLGRFRELRRFS